MHFHRQQFTFWVSCVGAPKFLMFTRARQEPWIAAVVASGALGLALYSYLSARRQYTADTAEQHSESERLSTISTTDFVADNMSAEDRAYHERFMREAISMVSPPVLQLHFCSTVSHHATDQSRAPG